MEEAALSRTATRVARRTTKGAARQQLSMPDRPSSFARSSRGRAQRRSPPPKAAALAGPARGPGQPPRPAQGTPAPARWLPGKHPSGRAPLRAEPGGAQASSVNSARSEPGPPGAGRGRRGARLRRATTRWRGRPRGRGRNSQAHTPRRWPAPSRRRRRAPAQAPLSQGPDRLRAAPGPAAPGPSPGQASP